MNTYTHTHIEIDVFIKLRSMICEKHNFLKYLDKYPYENSTISKCCSSSNLLCFTMVFNLFMKVLLCAKHPDPSNFAIYLLIFHLSIITSILGFLFEYALSTFCTFRCIAFHNKFSGFQTNESYNVEE